MAAQPPGRILSIIVPTLNEAARLPRLLDDLAAISVPRETIVTDGGSTDATRDLAVAGGCRVVSGPPGRGRQLGAGAAVALGDWLLILHADARLGSAAIAELESVLGRPDLDFAAWRLRLQGTGIRLRLIEFGAALRWRLFGLAYGDQGLLVKRTLYDAVGGYPDLPIMEDVELIRRLNRRARIFRFRSTILADPRRYLRDGTFRRAFTNLGLLALFSLGVPPARLLRWYQPDSPP